ncbi:39S ribosomal protein L47, mitochondrial [Aphelenchoides bicaudatus]|nr:39S ribosomal protein L47, mitochondrial [Aphelenchoides bicaudatus]
MSAVNRAVVGYFKRYYFLSTHFRGPVANRGLSTTAALFDLKKNSDMTSGDMLTFSQAKYNLREFFEEDEKNMGVGELRPKDRPGRAWSEDELRLKSNSDLHKLWWVFTQSLRYVLLKERNKLLTMKHLRESRGNYFANPERLDKVKESMKNLEAVVHERNDAVLRLETGDSASPPMRTVTSFAGFTYEKQAEEHYQPFEVTKTKEYEVPYLDDDAYLMQKLWVEKMEMKRRIAEHDEYVRIASDDNNNTRKRFGRTLRKYFNCLEDMPATMAQQQGGPSTSMDYGAGLDKRLSDLDEVDQKIFELLDTTKEIFSNLEKDKQISKTKMDETVKKFNRTLEEDIFRVVADQLNYMENLCVGAEHQGSMFKPQITRDIQNRSLNLMHKELETLVQPKEVEREEQQEAAEPELSEEENDSSFEDVVSVDTDESQ